jgi:ankyrin repeat protein
MIDFQHWCAMAACTCSPTITSSMPRFLIKLLRARRKEPLTRAFVEQLMRDNDVDLHHIEGGRSALHWAAQLGNVDIVELLLDIGVPVSGVGDDAPLLVASSHGHACVVDRLLRRGAVCDLSEALWMACNHNYEDVARLLIAAGADVNRAHWNNSPLTAATRNGHVGVVRLLIDAAADLDFAASGRTALELAASKGHAQIVPMLLAGGANPNRGNQWRMPLTSAVYAGRDNDVALLIAHGADVDVVPRSDNPRITALLCAAGWHPDPAVDVVDPVEFARALQLFQSLMRGRVVEMCVGLQSLRLPALVTLSIVDELMPWARRVRMAAKWELIVKVKHFKN